MIRIGETKISLPMILFMYVLVYNPPLLAPLYRSNSVWLVMLPSIAYVLVRLTESYGFLPLPQEGEYQKTIRQAAPDGSEYVNVLHVTPDGFWMEESNCEGHDCIGEGEVTLSNREERALWNMVICLPHRLSAELVTRAEAEQLLGMTPSGN